MGGEAPLTGLSVLVTRPAGQAQGLCRSIEQAGGRAVHFPVMEIRPLPGGGDLPRAIERLERYDLAIFISVNAVHMSLPGLLAERDWPAALTVAAIGRRTAEALEEYGLRPALVPSEGFSSEALLALPELEEVSGRRVAVFRGRGGRELLAATLRARGAEVDHIETYERGLPDHPPQALAGALEQGPVQAVTVASNESLENLFRLAGPDTAARLRRLVFVVINSRALSLARRLGIETEPVVAADATDAAVLAALCGWFRDSTPH